MRPIRYHLGIALFLSAAFCLLISKSSVAQTTGDADVAVVTHPDIPIDSLSLVEVRRVFLGERQYWNAKLPVVLLIRAPVAREAARAKLKILRVDGLLPGERGYPLR